LRLAAGGVGAAALLVTVDIVFSEHAGTLAYPPGYDGVAYVLQAKGVYLQILHGQLLSAADFLLIGQSPLWETLMAGHWLVLGEGEWQTFTIRIWPIALWLCLVWTVLRRRAGIRPALIGTTAAALLPAISTGLRASGVETITGDVNFLGDWYLNDLRPDFFAAVLQLWAIAVIVESDRPRKLSWIASGALEALAVYAKPSIFPLLILTWLVCVVLIFRRQRVSSRASGDWMRASTLALAVLLLPWMSRGGIIRDLGYTFGEAVTYQAAYNPTHDLLSKLSYYAADLINHLGRVEGPLVLVGAAALCATALRQRLDADDVPYLLLAVMMYGALTIPGAKNPIAGLAISLPIFAFVCAGLARHWRKASPRYRTTIGPLAFAVVSVYVIGIISAGIWGFIRLPSSESEGPREARAITGQIVLALKQTTTSTGCFFYLPAFGYPATLQYYMMDADGRYPTTPPIEVDPASRVADYVRLANNCSAVLVLKEDLSTTEGTFFFAPPVRRPYLKGVATWVRNPSSGYALCESWSFSHLAPLQHQLGSHDAPRLTAQLYVRGVGVLNLQGCPSRALSINIERITNAPPRSGPVPPVGPRGTRTGQSTGGDL
jgi:hypothetical protein